MKTPNSAAVVLPADTSVLDAAREAQRRQLHLITDGTQTVLSPLPLPGFFRVITKVKPLPLGEHTGLQEAA
jgi:hypothetical protein